jgi:hypothetical protein
MEIMLGFKVLLEALNKWGKESNQLKLKGQ